ncbi:MAG: class I SAM-dependent methyltransferase [Candidatus Firestonebacteria bacterium]
MKREDFFFKFFKGRKCVLDIGCGAGIFLEHLKQNGIEAEGVDLDPEFAKQAPSKGLVITCQDALEFLKNKPGHYDAVYMSHMAEHLDFKQLSSLFAGVHKSLRAEGIFVVVTPDIKNLKDIADGFWADPTHVRPYPLPALLKVFEANGFKVVEAAEKRRPYDRILWKLRDALRRALVGDFWGKDEVYAVGEKKAGQRAE